MNYKKTLNLPSTKFSMKANLQVLEPEIQKWWKEIDIYKRIRGKRRGRAKYILHDGPPYANGATHIGTALNKVLKDIIVKYKSSRGLDAPYVPGWDCHGLPIELAVMKSLADVGKKLSRVEIRQKCAEYAGKFIDIQRDEFKRLGVFGDWDRPYLTMSPEYEAAELQLFGLLFRRGLVHRSLRPIHWCVHCKTALAEAEIEYRQHQSSSIYIKFPLRSHPFSEYKEKPVSVFVWTTTPWTLPANTAVAVQPSFRYAFVRVKGEIFIILTELVARTMEEAGIEDYKIVAEKKGQVLTSLVCQHPFIDRESPIVPAEFVTKEEGTGCVHIAPAHGQDDFSLGQRCKLPLLNLVDEEGKFTASAGDAFAGLFVFDANDRVLEKLRQAGTIMHSDTITHSYPHCWRCKSPLIIRATKQWFISMTRDNLRDEVVSEIDKIKWIPGWGKLKITNMVKDRPDWCISRQRVWGVPIPAFYCKKCGEPLINEEIITKACEITRSGGSTAWVAESEENLLPPKTTCRKCGSSLFRREKDIFDVWFDSGVSYYAVIRAGEEFGDSSDIYLEANDQYRGWFQTTLLTSVGAGHGAPYKSALTHGFMVDGEGKKMSKSLGNLIATSEATASYGADILRLWMISENYHENTKFSPEALERVKDSYRRFRNTCRFILGNTSDFLMEKDGVEISQLLEIDRWALTRVNNFLKKVTDIYEEFSFHRVYHELYNFCVVELSSTYFDIIKDRLYTFAAASARRRSAQTALYEILSRLVRAVSPILPHTCEEIWKTMRHTDRDPLSVHLADWPSEIALPMDESAGEDWGRLIKIKGEVNQSLEEARTGGLIGSSLESKITLLPHNKDVDTLLKKFYNELPAVCIVSQVEISEAPSAEVSEESEEGDVAVKVEKASGKKCERCWRYCETVGEDKTHPAICKRCREVILR